MDLDFQNIVNSAKTLGQEPEWFFDSHDPKKLRLSVPLQIDDVVVEGLYLEGHCPADNQDTDVTFNIVYKPAQGLSGALYRLDWNPLHTHGNKGLVSGEWKYKTISGTHRHPFQENYTKGVKYMLDNNLPIAFPVVEPLLNFRDMLHYMGELFRITDIQRISPPPGTQRLV
jgi:hypothetical protein